MAVNKQPNGKWQGVYRDASGKRHTQVWPTKTAARAWAADGAAAVRAGEHRDPRAGRVTLAAWHERWSAARVVEQSTAAKNAMHWRVHVEPEWGTWPLVTIAPMDVQAWVRRQVDAGTGPPTIHAAVSLLSAMLDAAVKARRIPFNPCADCELPTIVTRLPRWFTVTEVHAICAELKEPYATLVDFGCHAGLRVQELTGLHGHRVDWLRSRVQVVDVHTRQGMREWPKSSRSRREVPIPPHLVEPLARLMEGRPRDAPVFRGPQGGLLQDGHFRWRIWTPALEAAGVEYAPPRTMRHTAASWLVQGGVDLQRVQALLGHESYLTTQRYSHLAPDAHDVVLDAWKTLTDTDRGRRGGQANA